MSIFIRILGMIAIINVVTFSGRRFALSERLEGSRNYRTGLNRIRHLVDAL